VPTSRDTARLTFGIYPGSAAGSDSGEVVSGPPDEPTRIISALDELQGRDRRPLVVRAYRVFADADDRDRPSPAENPLAPLRYTGQGRSLDLVVQYQSRRGDTAGYCSFLRSVVVEHGTVISTLQIGEEPNVTNNPSLDGYYPAVNEAVMAGVSAAKDEARRLGHHHLQVGFNTTLLFGPAASFINRLTQAGGQRFVNDLDYVGLDFFPDVFRPVPPGRLEAVTEGALGQHRQAVLDPAGLGAIPLRITEHGWPTGPGRPPARQAQVIRTVVTTIARNARPLGLAGYTHFALRDADSQNPGLFHQFGVMTDDYTPKPAFHTYKELIDSFSN
jgi:hypothetical protein